MKKQYKYIKPSEYKDEKADVNGIKRSALEFEWDRDIHPQVRVSIKYSMLPTACINLLGYDTDY